MTIMSSRRSFWGRIMSGWRQFCCVNNAHVLRKFYKKKEGKDKVLMQGEPYAAQCVRFACLLPRAVAWICSSYFLPAVYDV